MMDEKAKFLSDRLFSEELPVTYRLLSRALDLHVNHAKAALYEFHKDQNVRRANSVFATYLISGTRSQHEQLDADTGSSPDDEGAGYDSPTMTMTLVTEEKLQDVLAEYQQVDSIHVYSLSPHPQRDMALLSDVSKTIPEYTGKHDGKVDEARRIYGSILNPRARRKERKGGLPIPPPSTAPKPSAARPPKAEQPAAAPPKATQLGSKAKQEAAETSSNGFTPSSSTAKKPVPSLKRGESGSIMQSFAKAAARPPSQTKPAAKRKKEVEDEDEDTAMAMSDDGEADESELPAKKPSKDAEAEAANARSRKDREMELRRMMEEDDDEEEEAKEEAEDEDEEMAEAEPEPAVVEKPSEILSASSNGRRRGKRRVMKKKRILDDKGYMVTIQEEGWESFSEDEPPPTAPAPKPSTSTPASTSTGPKAKKNGAKGGAGQGSIMSFFTKK